MADETVPLCPACGARMTRHATKADREASRDAGCEMIDVSFCCPSCGEIEMRRVPAAHSAEN